jgi:hypothetical protein
MSRETIEGIHKAIQAHIDDQKEGHQLVDFVVARATLNAEGGWNYSYICSNLISPHGTVGLLERAMAELECDLMDEVDIDPKDI